MKPALPSQFWPFLWHFLRPYKHVVVLYVTLALLAGFYSPINSFCLKQVVNLVPSAQQDVSVLFWPIGLMVLNFIVFDNMTWRIMDCMHYRFLPIIKNNIIWKTFQYVLGFSHQFFQDHLSGQIANRIHMLAENIDRILNHLAKDLLRGFSLLIVTFVATYMVNPWFCFILSVWFILFVAFSWWISRKVIAAADAHAGAESMVSGQLVDNISNMSNIRIFAHKRYELRRMETFFKANQSAYRKEEWVFLWMEIVQGSLIAIMMAFMGYGLIILYSKQLVTPGDFALILVLSMELGHMVWWSMSQVADFYQAVGKCKQSLSHLIISQDIQDKPGAFELAVTKGEIRFHNVKFHYTGTTPLFHNKSITIAAGQKVGLVGYSGSGKSTFVNLILRLYDITEGQILIDNQDICDVTQDSLRKSIALIPQDPSLFHRTLMDNIRYGHVDASDEDVIKAAQKAHAHEFIEVLPQKYQSLVGERGIKLSSGQRQRIAIARAILKNAPILILDEATSQLDSVTEEHIQESLWNLMQSKTTIVIAHRLSTLLHMDRILVFDRGHIVEEGTHQELLKKKGLYKTLWDAQVGGFLPETR